ncbi:alkaline phosphatase family protein [Schlesneria paludicola]|uniref:alkaline phosphatase family protein n=1 Tax=Schlesneria paludicola TaxID=360056 RepID=UPI00029A82F4|nr:alkaline phosphatase family protein [Schlesneria paludicola]
MTAPQNQGVNRRTLLKGATAATLAAAATGAASYWLGSITRASRSLGKKVIVIGIDGMDPRLSSSLMKQGLMPNFVKMSSQGGFSNLGTSTPPQSPVAWANFINGAGPGSHGIFDFIHRHPHNQCQPFYSAAETMPGEGGWDIGDHRLQFDFWPFEHQPPKTVLRRQGVPFWDYLDAVGIPSTFYDLPANYPPSPSQHGHHRCLSGMGTPDMLGGYGTYQYFSEDGPQKPLDEAGGKRSKLRFIGETAKCKLVGPENGMLKTPSPIVIDFQIHRDRTANGIVVEIQGKKILLNPGMWSPWTKVDFPLTGPSFVPTAHISGICRFHLMEGSPNHRLYVTPINIDPSAPAVPISEPGHFIQDISKDLGLFYTTGFQEDHKARTNGVFQDDEFLRQASQVLDERLQLLEYAIENYDDGLLFFYFSSSDLQSHMFWWDSDERHPIRSNPEAQKYYAHVKSLYQKLDAIIGDLNDRYGSRATILVMSDHGFANFGRQFNLNSWLRDNGYLGPRECTSIMDDIDWASTRAYGLGINGLYLNLKGRERDGVVEPGDEQEALLKQLVTQLESVKDVDGKSVIRGVYRSDQIYTGDATALAPDLIIGYRRGFRASWETCLGGLTPAVLLDNDSAWSADHCADALEVPGLICCNRPIRAENPSLVDLAPSILEDFGLPKPSTMSGRSIFSS